jgi:hypothetical protein
MTQQRGSNVKILIGEETTFATAPADGFVMPFNSINLSPSQTINKRATIKSGRNPTRPFRGNKSPGGSVVVPVDSVAFWYWFQLMFGDPTTTGSDPYVHEFKIPTDQPSFTLEQQMLDLDTVRYFQYLGCKISTFSFGFADEGELVANLGIIAADFNDAASSFDASPTTITEAPVNIENAVIAEGGSTLSNGTNLDFNINFDLDDTQFVIGGGGVRGAIPEGVPEISGSLTTLFEDNAILTKADGATESSLKLTITESASSIFELECEEIEYSLSGPPIDGPRGVRVSFNWQAFYTNGSEASAIVARLTNGDEHA